LDRSNSNVPRKRSVPYVPQLAHWGAPLREQGQVKSFETFSAKSTDGVSLSGAIAGNPNGPAIVFIHGFSQCHLSWRRQLTDPELTARFRMVAYDMRGHGGSDKPVERERYHDDKLWADDLATVIAATNLSRPVVVAWSYGGRVVSDYLRFYSQDSLAGINYVAAVTKSNRAFWGPEHRHTKAMTSDDLTVNIRASRKLVHASFGQQLVGDDLDMTLAYTMLVPANIRASVLDRTRNEGEILGQLRVGVLVTHGAIDRIVLSAAGEYTASAVPGAQFSIYGGVGHSPFFEDARRFNRELSEFVKTSQR
jgi:non-heme chloroperoxidase